MAYNSGNTDNLGGLGDQSHHRHGGGLGEAGGLGQGAQGGGHLNQTGDQGYGGVGDQFSDRVGAGGHHSSGLGQQVEGDIGARGAHDHVSHGGVGESTGRSGLGGAPGLHDTQGNSGKPSFGDKIKGTFEEAKGKLTGDPAAKIQGEQRKQGDLSGGKNISGGAY